MKCQFTKAKAACLVDIYCHEHPPIFFRTVPVSEKFIADKANDPLWDVHNRRSIEDVFKPVPKCLS